jgi:hypothetical protein
MRQDTVLAPSIDRITRITPRRQFSCNSETSTGWRGSLSLLPLHGHWAWRHTGELIRPGGCATEARSFCLLQPGECVMSAWLSRPKMCASAVQMTVARQVRLAS